MTFTSYPLSPLNYSTNYYVGKGTRSFDCMGADSSSVRPEPVVEPTTTGFRQRPSI